MKLIQSGPRTASIVVVGEAPNQTEFARGIPFSGGAGDLLNEMLEGIGITREEVFVTNICHARPRDNDFDEFFRPELFREHYVPGVDQLQADLLDIKPNLIIALGNEALRVLTGKTGIGDWRGSVLECKLAPGKVIATYHPSSTNATYELKHIIKFDFNRVAEERNHREIVRPERTMHLDPDSATRDTLIEEMRHAPKLSIDIETYSRQDGKIQLDCVGFSDSAGRALVIKVRGPRDYMDIRLLCQSDAKKILQNGAFDISVLRDNDIEVRNFWWDTMVAHHVLYMESATGSEEMAVDKHGKRNKIQAFAKGLAFQTSIYTKEPYYKADGKISRSTGDERLHWLYNARDAAVTFEIQTVQERELIAAGMLDAFLTSMPEQALYMKALWHGIQVDDTVRLELVRETTEIRDACQRRLNEAAGWEVNAKSGDQVGKLLFEQLGMKPAKRTKTGRAAVDEDTLVHLATTTMDPTLRMILDVREKRQLLEGFLNKAIPGDGRMRCTFDGTGTRTMRLASKESIYGTGTNLQNQPAYVRRMYVPDRGRVFVYRDYSQAEARVVAYLARCHGLIELFRDARRDIHTENAARIFNRSKAQLVKDGGEVSEEERYLAKRTVHAANYGMGPDRFMEVINKEYETSGISIDKAQAKRLLESYFLLYPEIQSNYWRWVESELRRTLSITGPWGFTRTFYGRWNDKFLREGYSFFPQHTVGVLCRRAGVRIYQDIELARPELGVQWMLNVHDSILVQCNEAHAHEVAGLMRDAMNIEIDVFGQTFTIPTDCKIGHNWGDYSESNPHGLKKVKDL